MEVGVMPKERIYDSVGVFDAELQWSPQPSGHVQLATLMRDPQTPDDPADLGDLVDMWRRPSIPWRERIVPGMVVSSWAFDGFEALWVRTAWRDLWYAVVFGRGYDGGAEPTGAARTDADIPEEASLLVDPLVKASDLGRGLFATLDREGINRLIRVLRRARDQAYGRDE
jgi:hypothetical protein